MMVAAEMAPLARQLTASVADGAAGENMFLSPLSPTGRGAPTHYISTGMIEDTMLAPLQSAAKLYAEILEKAPDAGIDLSTCEALLTSSDISDDDPEVALARLGLKLIQQDIDPE